MIKVLSIRNSEGNQEYIEVPCEVYDYVCHLEMALVNDRVKEEFYKKYKMEL